MTHSGDNLGVVIKSARQHKEMTRKELAVRVRISTRHLMSIESGRHKPSYDLLYRIIRALDIHSDIIFYPEATHDRREFDQIIAMLHMCSDKERRMVFSMLESMLKDQ